MYCWRSVSYCFFTKQPHNSIADKNSLWEMGSKSPTPRFQLQTPLHPFVVCQTPNPPSSTISWLSGQMGTTNLEATPLEKSAQNGIPSESVAGPSHSLTPLSPSEVSTLLNLALFEALSTSPPTSFPMPASTLYSGYILPNRPAYIPREQRDDVVIGKSDWKKLAKWMKEVGKDGVLKIKDNKGDVTVLGYVYISALNKADEVASTLVMGLYNPTPHS